MAVLAPGQAKRDNEGVAHILPDQPAGPYSPKAGDLVLFASSAFSQNRVYEVIRVDGERVAYRVLADHYVDSLEALRKIGITPLREEPPAFIAKGSDPGPVETSR